MSAFTEDQHQLLDQALLTLYSTQNHLLVPTQDDLDKCRELLQAIYTNLSAAEIVVKLHGLVTVIAKLYPELTAPKFFAKLHGIGSPFFFLRTFVPYYYVHFVQEIHNSSSTPAIEALKEFRGWCAGDAHLENFGSSLNDSKDAIFAVNDFDDAAKGLPVADIVRFLASAKLGLDSPSTSDLEALVTSYLDGLKASHKEINKYDYSKPVSKLMEKSEEYGWDVKNKALDPTDPSKLAAPEGFERVDPTSQIWAKLHATCTDQYGPVTFLDAVKEPRDEGGSGGLLRYLVLLDDVPNFKKTLAIEFKQEPKPGMYPLVEALGGDVGSFSDRLARTLKFEIPSGASRFYKAVTLSYLSESNKPLEFLLRPRFQSNRGVSLADLAAPKDKLKVAIDEAFTLGVMHQGSADDSKGYVKAATKISLAQWLEAADVFCAVMTNGFSDIGNR